MLFADLFDKTYELNGRGPYKYDCYGFAIEVCRRLGHELPDIANNRRYLDLNSIFNTDKIKKTDKPDFGSVVVFLDSKQRVYHCGVVLKNNEFIHCNEHGVMVDNLNTYPAKGVFFSWLE